MRLLRETGENGLDCRELTFAFSRRKGELFLSFEDVALDSSRADCGTAFMRLWVARLHALFSLASAIGVAPPLVRNLGGAQ